MDLDSILSTAMTAIGLGAAVAIALDVLVLEPRARKAAEAKLRKEEQERELRGPVRFLMVIFTFHPKPKVSILLSRPLCDCGVPGSLREYTEEGSGPTM